MEASELVTRSKVLASGLILSALFGLAACGGTPASLSEASPAVREVNITGPNINIRMEQESRTFDDTAVLEAAMLIKPVVEALHDGVPGPTAETKRVVFDIRFGKPEAPGDPAPDRFGVISFPIDAMRKTYGSTIEIMNAAESVNIGSGASGEAAALSCAQNSDSVALAKRFCSLAI